MQRKGQVMCYSRYAIYYLPAPGPLATFGARWLGWDVETGAAVAQFAQSGLDGITKTPRKYGFHATLKPPFRLAAATDANALTDAVRTLATRLAPGQVDALALTRLGRFLALTPVGDASDIARVAAACVTELDAFRAPPSKDELDKRRSAGLSEGQESMLVHWGYPYVLDQFRFHMTLSKRLPDKDIAIWEGRAEALLPALPAPFVLDAIALVGEREDGHFELMSRHPLEGA